VSSDAGIVHALAAQVRRAVADGAHIKIAGCSAVHLAAESASELIYLPTPACGQMPGHLSLRRIMAVREPVSCRTCLRMVTAGQAGPARAGVVQPSLLELLAA